MSLTHHDGVAVQVSDLHKTFVIGQSPIRACHGITTAVDAGSVVALTGPSGSGKSTLLHLIGGIESPDSGAITVAGADITTLSRKRLTTYRRSVGLVFQQFNLLPALTAQDNVMAPLMPYRTDFDVAERATELLGQVGLQGRGSSLPSQLSGGQQQRVAIARALINRPGLILADEPTGALDSQTGAAVLDLLLSLRDQFGVTLIIATHDLEVAKQCDRHISLRDGRVVEDSDLLA